MDKACPTTGHAVESLSRGQRRPTRLNPWAAAAKLPAVVHSVALFDLDKTVIAKSSALAFGRPFYRDGLITRRDMVKAA